MSTSSKQRALLNKRVVILGGSTGIGFATAKAAAEDGALVVIVSSNQKKSMLLCSNFRLAVLVMP